MKLSMVFKLFLAITILAIFSGCNLPGSSSPDSAPAQFQPPTEIAPTFTVLPATPTPTALPPTVTPEPAATETPASYLEEFDSLNNWTYFLTSGDENKLKLTVGDGKLSFILADKNIWVYVIYQAQEYGDVKLDMVANNLGRNVNNISLVCRQSASGWYEFNISSSGIYNILAFDNNGTWGEAGYNKLAEGGSQAILTGKQQNTISASCIGNELSLLVNDTPVTTITDEQFDLPSGKVGVSVKSIEEYPVYVEIESVNISQP